MNSLVRLHRVANADTHCAHGDDSHRERLAARLERRSAAAVQCQNILHCYRVDKSENSCTYASEPRLVPIACMYVYIPAYSARADVVRESINPFAARAPPRKIKCPNAKFIRCPKALYIRDPYTRIIYTATAIEPAAGE